jgi:isoleucyl-tRNA synthetase
MFQPVGSRIDFPQLEGGILAFWKSHDIFHQSVEARRGGSRFVLYEGPPTANGSPGIHHVLARTFKDIIPRYKVMKGYYAPRIAGWDTHGLPVELEVEKELGFSGKAQIEEYGIDRFNQRCRESVFRYLKEWSEMTERIGYWVDLDKAYVTMDNSYIESVWWAIKQMWDKGLVYQGYKVTPHCPRCGTSLSSHEVALGYQDDTEDPSVYIKFEIDTSYLVFYPALERLFNLTNHHTKPMYLLAWTTTPWTLPGNTALAVNPEAEYVVVGNDKEYLILASARLSAVGLDDYKVVDEVKGSDLIHVKYKPLYNPHDFGVDLKYPQILRPYGEGVVLSQPEKKLSSVSEHRDASKNEAKDEILSALQHPLVYPVIEGDFVTLEDGTGIVHIAPAFGEVDFEAMQDDPDIGFVHHVDLQGNITGTLPGAGKFVKDADKDIMADLESRGLLYKHETIKHTYPFCWRCGTPLLYYAKQTWYIKTTAMKEKLISGNEEINWYPEHIKYGRFGDWLQNNVDWAFSRERYWGTPLPVWRCQSCGHLECVGSLEELKGEDGFSGFKEPLDLHRPFVDEITFDCPKCGKKMQRVPEVIDCWFDSGAMPIAQSHYPFSDEKSLDELMQSGKFPADYICEAVDQTRGWFYSLHAIATLLFERPCYRHVICLGHILDAEGEKMSKSRGNVVEPAVVIDKYGADALRWYFYTSSPPGNVRRFSEELVAEVSRRFLSTMWNVYSFFVLYANIDHFVPSAEAASSEAELDRWVLSELSQLVGDVDVALEGYDPTGAGRRIEEFVDGLSNWYVRRSRRRFWKSENDADKLSAYNTLYECLVTLAKLLAPFTPFVAEALYQNLVRSVFPEAPESVHLADFPVADKNRIDKQLMEATRLAMKVSSLGRAARAKAGIKVRQPLACVVVSGRRSAKENLERLKPQILEELNVKDLKTDSFSNVMKLEGKGYVVVSAKERTLDKEGEAQFTHGVSLVAISTEISPELAAEGMAREIVHRLQTMRRSAGFEIADSIITYYEGDDYIRGVMTDEGLAGYIRQETISRELASGIPDDADFKEAFKLSGHNLRLGVKRLK